MALLGSACSSQGPAAASSPVDAASAHTEPARDASTNERNPLARLWFLEYVRSELPVLRDPAATDWDKVNAVREWAYRRIPRAAPDAFLDAGGKPPEVIFEEFDRFQGGFACAGTAELLRDLYIDLGYDAYTYDMGTRDNDLSHMLTIVRIEHEGRKMLVVQDAYFNFTLQSSRGEPVGVQELLASLARDDVSAIVIASGKTDCKPVVTRAERAAGDRAYHDQYYTVGPIAVHEGMAEYCHDFSLATYEGLDAYTSWVESRIGRKNLLYLFLFPIGTSGGAAAQSIAEDAGRVRERLTRSLQHKS